jgi:hypothetical protein
MYAPDEPSSAEDRRAAWAGAFLLALVAAFYLLRGMPWVHTDDLVFIGAGIDLERTGQLVNYTMAGWMAGFGTDKFYIQLPFSTYSLAFWIRLFGASATSFIVFEWVWYVAGGFGLARVLGCFGLPLGTRLLLAIMYLTLLIQTGFRPEAQAFGLLFLGLGLLDAAAPFWQKFAALLMLGFSLLTYPMTLALAVPFTVALLWRQCALGQMTLREWRRETARVWLLPGVLAVVAVVMSFLAMIDFELVEFWSIFDAHRRSRVLPEGTVTGYFRLITEYREALLMLPPFLLLAASVLFVTWRWRQVEPELRALAIVCAIGAAGCISLYSVRAPGWVALLAFCAACSLAAGRGFRRYRWPIMLALSGLYVWSQAFWIVNASLRRFPDAAVWRAAREAALRTGKEVVVDSSTARYVFDYQLPERTRFLVFSKPWAGTEAVLFADKTDAVCWVVTAPTLDFFCADLPEAYQNYPRVMIGPHAFKSLALRPDEPLVLP